MAEASCGSELPQPGWNGMLDRIVEDLKCLKANVLLERADIHNQRQALTAESDDLQKTDDLSSKLDASFR